MFYCLYFEIKVKNSCLSIICNFFQKMIEVGAEVVIFFQKEYIFNIQVLVQI